MSVIAKGIHPLRYSMPLIGDSERAESGSAPVMRIQYLKFVIYKFH